MFECFLRSFSELNLVVGEGIEPSLTSNLEFGIISPVVLSNYTNRPHLVAEFGIEPNLKGYESFVYTCSTALISNYFLLSYKPEKFISGSE